MTAVLHLHEGDHVHTVDRDDPHHVEDGVVVAVGVDRYGHEYGEVQWPHGEWGPYGAHELEFEISWGAR